jgi:serine-type D-Ala-D-Ala carboxypeptidase/endopeptidase (penicillin-binding protein 4)
VTATLVAVRRAVVVSLTLVLLLGMSSPAHARAYWKRRINQIVGRASMGVAVRIDGDLKYTHDAYKKKIPASNEKLLLSMAVLHALGPRHRIETTVAAKVQPQNGILDGNLWILGRGDPTLTSGGPYADAFPFAPTRLGKLAHRIDALGITKIKGRVFGAKNYFSRDWFAPGWDYDFPAEEVALPSALALQGNTFDGKHVSNPEKRAAIALTKKLRGLDISVGGRPGAGSPPRNSVALVSVESPLLTNMLSFMNRWSSNFFAEMFGKLLGIAEIGRPGTIAKGASALQTWARKRGVDLDAYDGSGLSRANRVSPVGLTKLLDLAASEPWGDELRSGLPTGGQGTLEDRMEAHKVRAKTGTLDGVSTLSGWVLVRKTGEWVEFSIMSHGLDKSRAVEKENAIVRVIARYAR